MKIHSPMSEVEFSELGVGDCFVSGRSQPFYVAIKCRAPTQDGAPGAVIMWPGVPRFCSATEFVLVIHLPDATIVPSTSLDDWRAADSSFSAYSLSPHHRSLLVTAAVGGGDTVTIDLATGELADASPDAMRVSSWKIVQPAVGGLEYETICEYPPPAT